MLPPQELDGRAPFLRRPVPPVLARRVASGVFRRGHDAHCSLQPEFHAASIPGRPDRQPRCPPGLKPPPAYRIQMERPRLAASFSIQLL